MLFKHLWILTISLFLLSCSRKSVVEGGAIFGTSVSRGFTCGEQEGLEIRPKAIYGSDDRLDWFESPGQTKHYWARATVALFRFSMLQEQGLHWRVQSPSYGKMYNLCPNEKFYDQPVASFCTGFLVAPNLVVTAAHCIRNQVDCNRTAFVFDYAKTQVDQTEYVVPKKNLYECAKLIDLPNPSQDYALVHLDRPVFDRTPLNIRRQGKARVGQRLMMIGHPMGLPSKISEGGTILSVGENYKASLEAFTGSSGSPVFDFATGYVEGVLSKGALDFVEDAKKGCNKENVCDLKCEGEVVVPISHLADQIPIPEGGFYPNPLCEYPETGPF